MTDIIDTQEQKYGLIPDMEWLPINDLIIDEQYQRNTASRRSLNNIAIIRDNFSWAKCSPLTVANLGTGKYAVIDGQHRLEAARQLEDVLSLPCWILPQPRTDEQAKAFIGINKNRVAITPYSVYKAEIAAGDSKAVMVDDFCKRVGIIIPKNSAPSSSPNVTNALATIRSFLVKGMEDHLTYAVKTLRLAFPFKSGQLKAEMLKTIADLHREYGDKVSQMILIETLRSFDDVQNIINKARELTTLDRTINSITARRKIIINRYNELKKRGTASEQRN